MAQTFMSIQTSGKVYDVTYYLEYHPGETIVECIYIYIYILLEVNL